MQLVRRINRAQSCFGLRTVNLTKRSFDPIDSYAKTLPISKGLITLIIACYSQG